MWKLLIADDNFANRQLLVEFLRENAVCDVAVNGREAFDAYKLSLENKSPYNAILLDIAMPEVDGLTFLKMVRESEQEANTAPGEGQLIIMITAFDKPFMQAFNSGCDDYLIKPVDPAQLIHKLKMKLQSRPSNG